jgi:purine-nucleoside phosphorylase
VISDAPVKDILFIRKYPSSFGKNSNLKKRLQSIISSRGTTAHYAGHDITFFFVGCGKNIRIPNPTIIKKLNSGKITDIVDIGGGGALNPKLKRGDLILSCGDIPSDTLKPLKVKRREEIRNTVQALAKREKRHFFEEKILTSTKLIASKKERIALYEQTRCSIVQMEHCWFLRALQEAMVSDAFNELYITHMEIVSDVVLQEDTIINNALELFHGFNYCVLRNQHYLGNVKSKFLKLWLNNGK